MCRLVTSMLVTRTRTCSTTGESYNTDSASNSSKFYSASNNIDASNSASTNIDAASKFYNTDSTRLGEVSTRGIGLEKARGACPSW